MCKIWQILILVSWFLMSTGPNVGAQNQDTSWYQGHIKSLFAKVDSYYTVDFDKTLGYLNEIEQISAQYEDWDKVISAGMEKAGAALYHQKIKESKQFLRQTDANIDRFSNNRKFRSRHFRNENLIRWAYYYYVIGDIPSSIQSYRRIIESLSEKEHFSEDDYGMLSSSYSSMGSLLKKQGKNKEALAHYEFGFQYSAILHKTDPAEARISLYYRNLGDVYTNLKEYDLAEANYKEAFKIQKEKYDQNPFGEKYRLIGTCNQYADMLSQKGAVLAAKKMIAKSFSFHVPDDPKMEETLQLEGDILFRNSEFEEARNRFLRAKNLRRQKLGARHYKVAESNNALGILAFKEGKFSEAISFHQQALEILVDEFVPEAPFSNPLQIVTTAEQELLSTLHAKSMTALKIFTSEGSREMLRIAHETSFIAVDLIDSIRYSYNSDHDKLFLIDYAYAVFETAIETCWELHRITPSQKYIEQAFQVAEKNKSVLLFELLMEVDPVGFAGVPDSLIDREKELKYLIKGLKERVIALNKTGANSKELALLKQELFERERAYFDLMDLYRNAHPGFYTAKFQNQYFRLDEIQHSLISRKTDLISYFVGEQHGYSFCIHGDGLDISINRFPLNPSVLSLIEGYQKTIFSRRWKPFTEESNELFNLLVQPFFEELKMDALVILPDGPLWSLPFDAFLTENVDPSEGPYFAELPYLIKEKVVSYGFSAALFMTFLKREREKQKPVKILAVGPAYQKRRGINALSYYQQRLVLDTLIYNQLEADEISKICKGKAILSRDASKREVLNMLPGFDVLHLAAHAKADMDEPNFSFIAFANVLDTLKNPYKLYAHELYSQKLPLEMVVLSACETGTGPTRFKGEGVVSLSRAFITSGAKSVISTLWSADDKIAKEIMVRFYSNLQKGDPKDVALQQAKIHFMSKTLDDENVHPVYWASFVPIGNMDNLPIEGNNAWIFLLILGIIGLGFAWVFLKYFFRGS